MTLHPDHPDARRHAALQTAQTVLLKRLGGQEAAALATRVAHQTLGAYANRNRPDVHMPVDVVADLEAVAQAPLVTRQLAIAAGYALIPVRAAASDSDLAQRLALFGKESADVFGKAAEFLSERSAASGALDAREARALAAEIDEAIEALASVRALVLPPPVAARSDDDSEFAARPAPPPSRDH